MIFDRFFRPRERKFNEKLVGFPVPEGFSHFLTRNCVRSLLDRISMPTYAHFRTQNSPKSHLGASWERLGGALGRLGIVLERLGAS